MVTLTSCYTTQYIYDDPVYDTETVYVDPEPALTYYYDDFNPYYRFRLINVYYQQPYGYTSNWNTCSHFYHSNYYNHGCPQYYGYYNNYGYHNHTYWCGHGYGNTCNGYNNGYGNNWNGWNNNNYYGHRVGSFGHFRTSKPSRLALINRKYKKPVQSLVRKPVIDMKQPVRNVRTERVITPPKREIKAPVRERERIVIPTRERQIQARPNNPRNNNRNQYKPQRTQRYQAPARPTAPTRTKAPVRPQAPSKSNSKKRGG
jgi:hypothetical protein